MQGKTTAWMSMALASPSSPCARRSRAIRATRSVASNVPAEIEIKLFSNLCSVAPAAIEQLHMADYIAVQEAYQSFLG